MDRTIASPSRSACSTAVLALSMAWTASHAADHDAPPVDLGKAGDVPATLIVPSGHRLVFEASVTAGVQTYRCTAERRYVLLGPTALLRGHDGQLTSHYFGPSWQYQDGSVVTGKAIAKEPRANTIDQLLVQVIEHDGRPGLFSEVSYIQRLATSGGVAPAQCDPAKDDTLAVPYSAIYRFWAPAK